jgi:exopolyphosphatase/guanosine-5'-triphosphate,3'-diphosphate pyrophosphatase
VFDLGGGSTEVVSGVGERLGRWTSLAFGAVTLSEHLVASDPPTLAELDHIRSWVRDELMHGCASFPDRAATLAGVGGTVTVLAALDAGMSTYDPSQLEGAFVPRARLNELITRIVTASQAERRSMPVMGEGRADIVGTGGAGGGGAGRTLPGQRARVLHPGIALRTGPAGRRGVAGAQVRAVNDF